MSDDEARKMVLSVCKTGGPYHNIPDLLAAANARGTQNRMSDTVARRAVNALRDKGKLEPDSPIRLRGR